MDEGVCGLDAQGWEVPSAEKADSLLANDLREGAGPCADCFHFIVENNSTLSGRPNHRCARLVDKTTGDTSPADVVRSDVALCGPPGAWLIENAAPESNGELDTFIWEDEQADFVGW